MTRSACAGSCRRASPPSSEQVALELEHVRRKPDDLERYIGLAALQDRNETLFYRVLAENLEEFLPIVYTPTVGRACQEFSHILRRAARRVDHARRRRPHRRDPPRGVRRGHPPHRRHRQRAHPGPGRPGRGWHGHPHRQARAVHRRRGHLPRLDAARLPRRRHRPRGAPRRPAVPGLPRPAPARRRRTTRCVEAFVEAVGRVFPRAVLQWEDFKQHNALRILDRYRHRLPSFNDDVQGTGAVVLAGMLAARREQRRRWPASASCSWGPAPRPSASPASSGASSMRGVPAAVDGPTVHDPAWTDTGLVHLERPELADDQRPFAVDPRWFIDAGLAPEELKDPVAIARVLKPIDPRRHDRLPRRLHRGPGPRGGQPRRPAASSCPSPTPAIAPRRSRSRSLAWTDGRALIATGSPCPPVEFRRHLPHRRPGQQRLHLPRGRPRRHRGRGPRGHRRYVRGGRP